jgi:hypothetical protein
MPGPRKSCDMASVWQVAGSFRLEPVTTTILQQRQLMYCSQSGAISLGHHRDLVGNPGDSRQLAMSVEDYCIISQNEAGELVAPLVIRPPHADCLGHDFKYVEDNSRDDAIAIRTPAGALVALADRKTRPGDTVLSLTPREADDER